MSKKPSAARVLQPHEPMLVQQAEWACRAKDATALAGPAYERLLSLVETGRDSGQISRVAAFVAATVGLHRFDIYDLRALDVELSDDVLACLDAIRWGKCHIADLVPDGFARAHQAAVDWGYAAAV
jgi:hypothetical protein